MASLEKPRYRYDWVACRWVELTRYSVTLWQPKFTGDQVKRMCEEIRQASLDGVELT